jgi:hypothetical protein
MNNQLGLYGVRPVYTARYRTGWLLGGPAQPLELGFPGGQRLVVPLFRLVHAAGDEDQPAGCLLVRASPVRLGGASGTTPVCPLGPPGLFGVMAAQHGVGAGGLVGLEVAAFPLAEPDFQHLVGARFHTGSIRPCGDAVGVGNRFPSGFSGTFRLVDTVNERKICLGARADPELAQQVRRLAAEGNRTVSREVGEAIRRHVLLELHSQPRGGGSRSHQAAPTGGAGERTP